MEFEFELEEMQREASKLSVGIFGPSGSGKTTGSILIAMGIRDLLYPGQKLKDIALLIDTERRSSTKSVGRSIGGEVLEALTLYPFEPPYNIEKLYRLLEFAREKGFKIIIIDGLSQFWSGKDGILERASELDVELADKKKAYGAWSEKEIITKKNILKNILTNSDMHIIFTMRAKTEYVMEPNRFGKMTPRAVGLQEDMQSNIRYEPDVVISIDRDTHNIEVVKDRLAFEEILLTDTSEVKTISTETGKTLAKLVSEGVSPEELYEKKKNKLISFILDEKAHKSSKVAVLEKSQGRELTKELLTSLDYEKLTKIVKYIN